MQLNDQPHIRNKDHGSVYRIIRTTIGYTRSYKGVDGPDLYFIIKGRNPDGSYHRSTSWLSVAAFTDGHWEAVDPELDPENPTMTLVSS